MVREEIGGKRVYVVERHHQVLEAWAEIRRGLNFSPSLLSLDRHNDTRPAFWRHMASLGLVTDDHYCNPELALKLLATESAKYNYQNPASIIQAIANLRHDEHIDAAVRLGIISRAFIIAFDQHEIAQRDPDGNFQDRGDHIYVCLARGFLTTTTCTTTTMPTTPWRPIGFTRSWR